MTANAQPADVTVRDLLDEAVREGPLPVDVAGLAARLLSAGDPEIDLAVRPHLPPGLPLHALLAHAPPSPVVAFGPGPLTSRADAAVREYSRQASRLGAAVGGRGPLLLLACVLQRFDEVERRAWLPLDVDGLCRTLARTFERTGWFALPAGLPPSENLTRRVHEAAPVEVSPFDGDPTYEALFEALARGLHRSAPRHVLLVGERGVGQTTLLTELARRSTRMPYLADRQLLLVDCRFVPPDESRDVLHAVFGHLVGRPDVVVAIDGLAALLRGPGGATHRPHLLNALTRVPARVIGLMEPSDAADCLDGFADAADFFGVVQVPEPDPATATRLLRHFARGLERRFDVVIDDAAAERAVKLTDAYVLNERLPAKALRVLHAACDDLSFERTQLGSDRRAVTEDDVFRRVSETCGIAEGTLRGIADNTDYHASLSDVIVGQDHAVRAVATELSLVRAGMSEAGRPASVLMFVGPTGTGKTELAKALARFYSGSKRLKVFTLGDFVESHSVSGIIGVPAGYVGHDHGGRIVNELLADPHGVFLLDEADKAHPDVLQPFLNLFAEGWIYDRRGVKAHADRAIFILTSNVGQRQIVDLASKGEDIEAITAKLRETLPRIRHPNANRPVFSDEFLARIRRVIVFRPLDAEAMTGITERVVRQLAETWREKRNKKLQVDAAVQRRIASEAHERNAATQSREGGRIVRKLVADHVEAHVERAIAEDPQGYVASRVVRVKIVAGAVQVSFR